MQERIASGEDKIQSEHMFMAGGGEMGRLIRAYDWASTPLGPPSRWPQSLRSALSICLHSSFPMAIYWGPELRLLYNDAWSPIPADRHPGALGQPAKEVWFDIWDIVGPQMQRVLANGEGYALYDQLLPMIRNGVRQETFWNYSLTAIRGEDGAIVGILNQGNETTAAVLASRQAKEEIDRLAHMVSQAPGAVAVLRGPTHVFELANPAYEAMTGRTGLIGLPLAEVLPEVVGQGFISLLDKVYATGEPFIGRAVPVNLERRPGEVEERLLDFVYQPLNDTQGRRHGIFVQASDVTEVASATAALRESEEFSRSVVESSGDCIKVISPDGRLLFMNENGRRLMEIDDFDNLRGQHWTKTWPPENRPQIEHALATAHQGEMARFSAYCPTAKGTPKWWDVVVSAVMGRDGKPERMVSISRDVTEQRLAEEARQLLLRELNHRVKNLFAITSGMVSMTARFSPTVKDMAETLKGRILALAKAHELIGTAVSGAVDTRRAPLRELIEEIVRPHLQPGDRETLTLDGPALDVGSSAATSLALIFHEIATNAAKYGALAEAGGKLAVSWRRDGDAVVLCWQETLGADAARGPVTMPATKGFGTQLATTSATSQLKGGIHFDWKPSGVIITLNASLDALAR